MDIAFSGRHTRSEYLRAVYAAYRPTLQYFFNRAILTFAVGSLYVAYQVSISPDRSLPVFAPSRLIWHILALVLIVILLLEPFLAPFYIAYRLWRDPSAHAEWQGTVGPRGITFTNSGRSMQWDAFQEVLLPPDMLILKTKNLGFLALPRVFFQQEADWKKARNLAETRVHPITFAHRPTRLRR
jgi:hypothetical protein